MREIPIADFLSTMGIQPTRQKGNTLWYSAPYRTERTPSFKVDTAKNVWFDFGTGKGGDIFDLAGEFIGSGDFLLRAAFIAKSGACPLPALEQPQRSEKKEPTFEDIWKRPLFNRKDCWVIWKNEESMPTLPSQTARRFDTGCMANGTMPSAFVMRQEEWNCVITFSRAASLRRIFH